MGLENKPKRELLSIISQQKEKIDQAKYRNGILSRKVQTVEGMYHIDQTRISATTAISDNLKILLDAEKRDSKVLLRIQSQLITMLGGKVLLCPSCGKVSEGADGPHLVICSKCINKDF